MELITRDYVAYMTSAMILVGGEVDKIISILVVTGLLAAGAARGRLRQRFTVVSLTLLTTSLVISVSRRNFLQWDAIISCQMTGHHKPHPEAYQKAAQWLALDPEEILMVACHNFDLNAARACGYRSAFVRRPAEWGPESPPDPVPNPAHDFIVDSFPELAGRRIPPRPVTWTWRAGAGNLVPGPRRSVSQ